MVTGCAPARTWAPATRRSAARGDINPYPSWSYQDEDYAFAMVRAFSELGLYLALLWPSHHDRGQGLGSPMLYYDAHTGARVGVTQPGHGTAADVFTQMQFPLHSGQIGGLAGRIVVCALGLVVAMLSVTGVVIWWKKRRSREVSDQRAGRG